MELKNYQKNVIKDISRFLSLLTEKQSASKAYAALWQEKKGDHLDNDESKAKAKIGHQWDTLAGSKFRYFMVFQTKSPDYPGAYSYDRFMEIVKEL